MNTKVIEEKRHFVHSKIIIGIDPAKHNPHTGLGKNSLTYQISGIANPLREFVCLSFLFGNPFDNVAKILPLFFVLQLFKQHIFKIILF